jgi:hypothetical protein
MKYRALLISSAKIDPANPPRASQYHGNVKSDVLDWAAHVLTSAPPGSTVSVREIVETEIVIVKKETAK